MDVINSIMKDLRRGRVIFRAYMIHERDSEFAWRPRLEELCKRCFVKVDSHSIDLPHESMRLNMIAGDYAKRNMAVPPYIASKLEHVGYSMTTGTHWLNKVFDITLSVNPGELEENKVSQDRIDAVVGTVAHILEDSRPEYLAFDK